MFIVTFFYAKGNTGRERGPATKLPVNPKFIALIRTSPVQVSEVSHDVLVDLAFERLQVIFRREHRAGKENFFTGMFAL